MLVAAAGAPSIARAQDAGGRPYSIDQVAEAVATGLGTRILSQARTSCISFVIDATTERRLRAAGAEPDFTAALRDVCYQGTSLSVATAPPGAEVWVQDRLAGKTPWVSPMPAMRNVVVEVRLDGRSRRVTADLVPDSLVTIQFDMPRDTVDLPPAPSETELRMLRAQAANFDLRSRPAPPKPPTPGGSVMSIALGGLAGAVAAVAVGSALCRRTVTRYGPPEIIGGDTIRREIGTAREVNGGCVGLAVGTGVAVGGLTGRAWGGAAAGRRRRRYEQDSRIYQQQLAQWEAQQQAAARLERHEAARAERERVAARNAAIRASNANIAEPRVSVDPPARLSRAVPNFASP